MSVPASPLRPRRAAAALASFLLLFGCVADPDEALDAASVDSEIPSSQEDVRPPIEERDASPPDMQPGPGPDVGFVSEVDANADASYAELSRDPRCDGFRGALPSCDASTLGLICMRLECESDSYETYHACTERGWQFLEQTGFDCPGE